MTISGVTTFNPSVAELTDQAYALAGTEPRTGWDFRVARFALNALLQEWANRGINLWTLANLQQLLTSGTSVYTLPTDIVDVYDVAIRINPGVTATQSDVRVNRISMSVYTAIPNKLVQGRPIQYMVDRQISPTITFWPVPDSTNTWYAYITYLRRINDAGSDADNTMDIPARFYPAFLAGLAYQLSMRKPELADRVQFLKAEYESQWDMASSEDREKAPVTLNPYLGPKGY